MKRRTEKLLKDMSSEELSAESLWHSKRASKLFLRVRGIRKRALTVTINEALEMMRSAMEVEFEAEEHMHHSNVLDSVRAARLSDAGAGVVVPVANAYTVRESL